MSALEQLAAKAQVTGDVGDGLDKALEAAKTEVDRLVGGAHWLKEGANKLSSLAEHINKDFEENKFDNLDGKAIHDLLLDYNRKATECILNFAELKKSESYGANGRVLGLKGALELVGKHHEAATMRAKQIMQAIESEEPPVDEAAAKEARRNRALGERPGPSPLDGRRLEALKSSELPALEKKKKNSKKEKI
jgi:hypothetical protein